MKQYNPSKLTKELRALGLAVSATDSDGKIIWSDYPRPTAPDREMIDGEWIDLAITPVPAELLAIADAVKANHDPSVEPAPSKVKPLKAVINSLITLKDDGTYDFSEAMQFTSWLEATWARKILEPIFAMAEADISKVEAAMLAQFIASEVRQGKLSEGIATKIGALLDAI